MVKRKVKRSARISENAYQLLRGRAEYWEARGKKKIWSMEKLATRYILLGAPHFLEAKEFDKHVSEGFTSTDIERPKREEGDCQSLRFIRKNWRCVKKSKTGTVKRSLLGPDKLEAKEACVACVHDSDLEKRFNQIRSKDKLGVEEHTYCTDGGWYDDKTGRINCKKMNRWMNQDICFTIAHGKPCPSLKTLPARRVKRTGIQRRKR